MTTAKVFFPMQESIVQTGLNRLRKKEISYMNCQPVQEAAIRKSGFSYRLISMRIVPSSFKINNIMKLTSKKVASCRAWIQIQVSDSTYPLSYFIILTSPHHQDHLYVPGLPSTHCFREMCLQGPWSLTSRDGPGNPNLTSSYTVPPGKLGYRF